MNRALWKAKGSCDLFNVENYTEYMGKWVYGYIFKDLNEDWIMIENETTNEPEIDSSTLCQCIGVPDKNKQLIFEGDIDISEPDEPMYVAWDEKNACWGLKFLHPYNEDGESGNEDYIDNCIDWENCIIKGSIHDKEEDNG